MYAGVPAHDVAVRLGKARDGLAGPGEVQLHLLVRPSHDEIGHTSPVNVTRAMRGVTLSDLYDLDERTGSVIEAS